MLRSSSACSHSATNVAGAGEVVRVGMRHEHPLHGQAGRADVFNDLVSRLVLEWPNSKM